MIVAGIIAAITGAGEPISNDADTRIQGRTAMFNGLLL